MSLGGRRGASKPFSEGGGGKQAMLLGGAKQHHALLAPADSSFPPWIDLPTD